MMYWSNHHMSGWGYGLMTISMVLFWGLVIFAIIALIRYTSRTDRHPETPPPAPRATPEQLLAERFARGEITPEDYQQRLDIFRGDALSDGRPLSKR